MKFPITAFLAFLCFFPSLLLTQDNKIPLADVKLVPPKQYKMQKKDMNHIKEVLEEEQEIKSIEEKWALKERMRESAFGKMNLQNSQFSPLPGASPPFPAYLSPLSKKDTEADARKKNQKEEKNEKTADKLAEELFMVNSAINQLKKSMDQSKRTLEKSITKMVSTIVHSQTNDLMNNPQFKEINPTPEMKNWNVLNARKLSSEKGLKNTKKIENSEFSGKVEKKKLGIEQPLDNNQENKESDSQRLSEDSQTEANSQNNKANMSVSTNYSPEQVSSEEGLKNENDQENTQDNIHDNPIPQKNTSEEAKVGENSHNPDLPKKKIAPQIQSFPTKNPPIEVMRSDEKEQKRKNSEDGPLTLQSGHKTMNQYIQEENEMLNPSSSLLGPNPQNGAIKKNLHKFINVIN